MIRIRLYVISFLLLVVVYSISQERKDFYTDIASTKIILHEDSQLEEIPPVNFPMSPLFVWNGDTLDFYKRMHKVSSEKEVEDGISTLRKKYSVFIKDLAPKMQDTRSTFRIEKMCFRYETHSDRLDFSNLINGYGLWEEVTMPYYHGPQGPSTAWYRTILDIPNEILKKDAVFIHFNGSDYYTDVFVNGHHVGSHEGMLDEFEFNIKPYLKSNDNVLLVRVRNDFSLLGSEGKKRMWGNKLAASNSPGWDDPETGWNCCPAGYGIYQDIYIEGRSLPFINDIFCRPIVNDKSVELWVEIDLPDGNMSGSYKLGYSLYGQNFKECVFKNSKTDIDVVGGRILKKIRIKIPESQLRLWTPDTPWLYQMQVSLIDVKRNMIIDNIKRQFGMRFFEISEVSEPKGRMYLNGREIRLRGTNTMGFLQRDVMAHDWEQLEYDLLYAKFTNINFIRTTQRIVQKEVYEMADRVGMMMQADLPLFAYINQKQYTEIIKQASGIERLLRNHPSVIMMSYLNESMAEKKPHAISRFAYENLFDALDVVVHNENPDRAVKYVDGDYQSPNKGYPDNHCYNIWYDKHGISINSMEKGAWMSVKQNWMYGCGEFGAEGLDSEDLMRRCYPQNWLEEQNNGEWSPARIGGQNGAQTWQRHFDWFETQDNMSDWVDESRKHQEWGISKVTRAFRRMPRMNSFAVHLFIDAWPNGWLKAIVDCERIPKPAWYAYRDALTPLSVQLIQDRNSFYSEEKFNFPVWICNDTHKEFDAEIKYVLELEGKCIDSGSSIVDIPSISEGSRFQGVIPVVFPKVCKKSDIILRVALFDKKHNIVLHEDIANIRLYPKNECSLKNVCTIGSSLDSNAIINFFNIEKVTMEQVSNNSIFFVSDSCISSKKLEELMEYVENGAKVIFLNSSLDGNIYKFLKLDAPFIEDDSWILCRNKHLDCFKTITSTDFKYNYSSNSRQPERHRFKMFKKDNIIVPVLTYKGNSVIGYINYRNGGKVIICGLRLSGIIDTTPALSEVLLFLLNN